jgi:hypothetical protein
MRILLIALLAFCATAAQPGRKGEAAARLPGAGADAARTRAELNELLQRYPPTVRNVLEIDHSLLGNQPFLEPYPALASFLEQHPEVARNPAYYVGDGGGPRSNPSPEERAAEAWRETLAGLASLMAFALGIGLVVWLVRTMVDSRRWKHLAKVQAEAHTKLLDRFTSNEDLLAYIQSPAGAKFLEAAPISIDAGPRSVAAPMGRILWSVQGGVVLVAAGIGLAFIHVPGGQDGTPLQAMSILAIALGAGFLVSALISYVISRRLGLIEPRAAGHRELQGV